MDPNSLEPIINAMAIGAPILVALLIIGGVLRLMVGFFRGYPDPGGGWIIRLPEASREVIEESARDEIEAPKAWPVYSRPATPQPESRVASPPPPRHSAAKPARSSGDDALNAALIASITATNAAIISTFTDC